MFHGRLSAASSGGHLAYIKVPATASNNASLLKHWGIPSWWMDSPRKRSASTLEP